MNTRLLPVQLTEEEIKVKGEELAKDIKEHRDLELEKKAAAADFSKRMKTSSDNLLKLAQIVESGKEDREVPIKKEFDTRKNLCRITRLDSGDLVEARPMTEDEYQTELFADEVFENE